MIAILASISAEAGVCEWNVMRIVMMLDMMWLMMMLKMMWLMVMDVFHWRDTDFDGDWLLVVDWKRHMLLMDDWSIDRHMNVVWNWLFDDVWNFFHNFYWSWHWDFHGHMNFFLDLG